MSLLFANVAEEFAMKKAETDEQLSSRVSDLFDDLGLNEDNEEETATTELKPQQMFMVSVASEYYQKSIEDINNTRIGNKSVRRKNFQQIMKESFFYGANRFGNNFIA